MGAEIVDDVKFTMRTTLNLDDDLLATAARLTGISDRTPLLRESLKALIARESARRLALLGASQPDLVVSERRRSVPRAPGRKRV